MNDLKEALEHEKYECKYLERPGYNHSMFYISSFLEEHFKFHAKYLEWYA